MQKLKAILESKLGSITDKQFELARLDQMFEVKFKYRNFNKAPSKGERLNILATNIEFYRNHPELLI